MNIHRGYTDIRQPGAYVAHDGSAVVIKNVICIHEEDAGLLWKHTDFRPGGRGQAVRSRRLVVSMVCTLANYVSSCINCPCVCAYSYPGIRLELPFLSSKCAIFPYKFVHADDPFTRTALLNSRFDSPASFKYMRAARTGQILSARWSPQVSLPSTISISSPSESTL